MRRRLIGLCAGIVSVVLAAGGGAAAAATACTPAGARTLATAGNAALYVQDGALYGCLGAARTLLGGAPGSRQLGATRVALYALSPRYAGLDTARMGVDTFASSVSIVDLRSGSTLASAAATTPELRAESFVTATAIAIARNGTLAWIGSRSAVGAFTPIYEVHTLTATGAERMLASSPKIAPHSLALTGTTLSWRQSGRRHSTHI